MIQKSDHQLYSRKPGIPDPHSLSRQNRSGFLGPRIFVPSMTFERFGLLAAFLAVQYTAKSRPSCKAQHQSHWAHCGRRGGTQHLVLRLEASLRGRPKPDFHPAIKMLRAQLALQSFAASANSSPHLTHWVQIEHQSW